MSIQRVLLVDDSDADQFIAKLTLEDVVSDVQITQVMDGVEAMALIDERGEDAFDIILLDINMPRMDGLAFLERYSERPRTKPPVVVMLTSSGNTTDRRRCEQYDCVEDYQVKPIDPAWVARTFL